MKNENELEDRADAMLVLEKCAEKIGNVVEISGSVSSGWIVSGKHGAWESEAETLPLAICKFAKELFKK